MEDFEFRERNLYSPEGRKDAIDSGAISAEDDGFMAGFNEDSEEVSEAEEEPDYEKEWDNQPEDKEE
jgi:hypothetical protein